jgi:hypothetical protein
MPFLIKIAKKLPSLLIEPCHDKTNIIGLRPAWIQTSLRAQSDQDPFCSLSNPITCKETDSEQH